MRKRRQGGENIVAGVEREPKRGGGRKTLHQKRWSSRAKDLSIMEGHNNRKKRVKERENVRASQ